MNWSRKSSLHVKLLWVLLWCCVLISERGIKSHVVLHFLALFAFLTFPVAGGWFKPTPLNLIQAHPPLIYILSRLSSKKGRTESRQNIVANSLCQFLPFTYTWTRKGKTGLKQNNTNETLVTSFKVAMFLDGIETIDHKHVFTCLLSIV